MRFNLMPLVQSIVDLSVSENPGLGVLPMFRSASSELSIQERKKLQSDVSSLFSLSIGNKVKKGVQPDLILKDNNKLPSTDMNDSPLAGVSRFSEIHGGIPRIFRRGSDFPHCVSSREFTIDLLYDAVYMMVLPRIQRRNVREYTPQEILNRIHTILNNMCNSRTALSRTFLKRNCISVLSELASSTSPDSFSEPARKPMSYIKLLLLLGEEEMLRDFIDEHLDDANTPDWAYKMPTINIEHLSSEVIACLNIIGVNSLTINEVKEDANISLNYDVCMGGFEKISIHKASDLKALLISHDHSWRCIWRGLRTIKIRTPLRLADLDDYILGVLEGCEVEVVLDFSSGQYECESILHQLIEKHMVSGIHLVFAEGQKIDDGMIQRVLSAPCLRSLALNGPAPENFRFPYTYTELPFQNPYTSSDLPQGIEELEISNPKWLKDKNMLFYVAQLRDMKKMRIVLDSPDNMDGIMIKIGGMRAPMLNQQVRDLDLDIYMPSEPEFGLSPLSFCPNLERLSLRMNFSKLGKTAYGKKMPLSLLLNGNTRTKMREISLKIPCRDLFRYVVPVSCTDYPISRHLRKLEVDDMGCSSPITSQNVLLGHHRFTKLRYFVMNGYHGLFNSVDVPTLYFASDEVISNIALPKLREMDMRVSYWVCRAAIRVLELSGSVETLRLDLSGFFSQKLSNPSEGPRSVEDLEDLIPDTSCSIGLSSRKKRKLLRHLCEVVSKMPNLRRLSVRVSENVLDEESAYILLGPENGLLERLEDLQFGGAGSEELEERWRLG